MLSARFEAKMASEPIPSPQTVLAKRQSALIESLSGIQHQTMSLKRAKYRVVRRVAKSLKWDVQEKDDKDATIVWLDRWEHADLTNLRTYKVGHFPGMSDLGTKCQLGKTLNRLRQEFPLDYDFHPLSFSLPNDKDRLAEYDAQYRATLRATLQRKQSGRAQSPSKKDALSGRSEEHNPGGYPLLSRPAGCWPAPGSQPQPLATAGDRMVYIVKPDGGSRGQGIYLALGLEGIEEYVAATQDPSQQSSRPRSAPDGDSDQDDGDKEKEEGQNKNVMVQAYLPRPLLIDNRKFDLRIYVLVTSVYPTLRLYVYSQGLVRFATVPYKAPDESNIAQRRMFLTNYAVNKPGERPRSPKTGIDDVPEGTAQPNYRSSAVNGRAARFDKVVAGGSDRDKDDDNSDGSDDDGDDGSGGGRWGPPRDKGIDLVRQRVGCKWTLSSLWECLEAQGVDTEAVWARIKDVITKTILAVRPSMAAKYRAARPQIRKEPTPAWAEVKAVKKKLPARAPSFLARVAEKAAAAAALQAENQAATAVQQSEDSSSGLPEEPVRGSIDSVADAVRAALAASAQTPAPAGPAGNRIDTGPMTLGAASQRKVAPLPATQLHRSKSEARPSAGPQLGLDFGLTITAAPLCEPKAKVLPLNKAAILREKQHSMSNVLAGMSITGQAVATGPALSVTGARAPSPSASGAGVAVGSGAKAVAQLSAQGPAGQALLRANTMSSLPISRSASDAASVNSAVTGTTASSVSAAAIPTAGAAGGQVIAPGVAPTKKPPVPTFTNTTAGGSKAAASSSTPKSSIPVPAGLNLPPNLPPNLQGLDDATLAALQEEDGEQGFRAYEFMGLDIILDMSHCACERTSQHQRLSSDSSAWAAAKSAAMDPSTPRCQPRPVLLEINQSCSMHTDTDLDIVVKGDAVHDAFGMVAADERWLLESFVAAIKASGGLAAVANGAGAGQGLEVATAAEDNKENYRAGLTGEDNCATGTCQDSTCLCTPAGPLLDSLLAGEASLKSQNALQTKVTATGTTVDLRACLNDITRMHTEAVDRKRAGLELSAQLLGEAWARGLPAPPATPVPPTKTGAGQKGPATTAPAAAGGADYDPSQYGGTVSDEESEVNTSTGSAGVAALAAGQRPTSARVPLGLPGAGAANLRSEIIPWVAPPSGPGPAPVSSAEGSAAVIPPFLGLYGMQSLQKVWTEEFWFGLKHHEPVLAAAAARAAKALAAATATQPEASGVEGSKGKPAGTVGATTANAGAAASATTATPSRAVSSSSSSASAAGKTGHTYTLSTVPQLSARAQLVLLLRRVHESIHQGGFERMVPPTDARLAERYKRIAEYVPPALRETPAYARRRLEALAVRAAIEAKKGSASFK